MSWGFEPGRVYNRRQDIHARFNGQQRGGMITPADHNVMMLVTGEEGEQHGYLDHWGEDGAFYYFGHGQRGDMELKGANRRLAESNKDGRSVLLFQTTPNGVKFIDEVVYEDHELRDATDTEGHVRQAIVFKLWRLGDVQVGTDAVVVPPTDLEALRNAAYMAAGAVPGRKRIGNVYERSAIVRAYVLERARGECEGCKQPAPFKRKSGEPYLEPHHLTRVSDGGPDHPANVIALCPTCHRWVHFGEGGDELNLRFFGDMVRIEPRKWG